MNIPKQVKTKNVAAIVLVAILLTTVGCYFTFAQSSAFTISPGIYSGAPSYTIYKEGSYYYAKNAYGAIEFSGTDASSVLQYALNNENATVFVGKGIYALHNTINITKNYVTLKGDGYGSHLKMVENKTMIRVAGESNDNKLKGVVISDLYIEGFHPTNRSIEKDNIYMQYVLWCVIRHIYMYGGPGQGIHIYYSQCITIDDVRIVDVSGFGIWGQILQDSVITGVHVYGSLKSNLHLQTASTVAITGGSFDTSYEHGILIYDSADITISGCQIYDNNFQRGTPEEGHEPGTWDDVTISSSNRITISDCAIRGTYVNYHVNLYSSNNCSITNNLISGTPITAYARDTTHNNFWKGQGFQNSGSVTFTGTSVVVYHKLFGTPTNIVITPAQSTGYYWVSSRGSTTFTISVGTSGTYTFYWYAEYKP